MTLRICGCCERGRRLDRWGQGRFEQEVTEGTEIKRGFITPFPLFAPVEFLAFRLIPDRVSEGKGGRDACPTGKRLSWGKNLLFSRNWRKWRNWGWTKEREMGNDGENDQ
jgi:hypothetical protein